MMYRTCTIQVTSTSPRRGHAAEDAGLPEAAAARTALFCELPLHRRKPNGAAFLAGRHLRDTDNRRSGLLPTAFKPDFGFSDYVEWALDVPMYFVVRDGHYHDCTHVTFRQFMNGALKGEIAEWQPTMGELDQSSVDSLSRRPSEAFSRNAAGQTAAPGGGSAPYRLSGSACSTMTRPCRQPRN